MQHIPHPHRQATKALMILMAVLFTASFFNRIHAQNSISGPLCVVAGVPYNYTFSAYYSGTSTFNYSISGGTFSTGGTSGSHTGPGVVNVTITWTGNGNLILTSPNGFTQKSVSLTTAISGGTISSGLTQYINYNTTPAGITCPAATGGGCPTPSYTYQWRYSTDGTNYYDVSGQTGLNLTFSSSITQTTYYKRLVTDASSSGTAYSTIATVNVYPQINPGSITPAAITISPGQSPGQLSGSLPTGGNGTYTYAWYSSATSTTVLATTQNYTPGALTATTSFWRAVTSNGVTAQTPNAVVSVIQGVPAASNAAGSPNNDFNWIISTGYDASGNMLSQGKNFFNNSGEPLQSQNKVFYRKDASTVYTHVFANQPIRDAYGRDAVNTLPAPIDYADFNYIPGFVQASDGSNYTYKNFDRFNPSGTETNLTNSPQAVGGQSLKGTLGWYYGSNNTWEPYTPTTNYPYTRQAFYSDGTTADKKQAAPGEALVMGSGHEISKFVSPVAGEYAHYLSVRNKFFTSAQIGVLSTDLLTNGTLTVARDPNGSQEIHMSDAAGRTIMRARPGADVTLSCTASVTAPGTSYSALLQSTDHLYVSPSTTQIQVYTGATLFYSGAASGFVISTLGAQTGNVLCQLPFTYQKCPAAGCAPLAYATMPPSIQYFNILADATPVSITGGTYTLYDMNTEAATTLIGGNSLNRGYYKLVALTGNVSLTYSSSFTDVSYDFYNQLGQLVASIAPEGVKKLFGTGINNYSTLASIPFTTTYTYDTRGHLVTAVTPDGGTSNFIYRVDGKMRFAQNALQAAGGTYSYTMYDNLGRPVETGQYLPADGISFNSAAMTAIIENTSATGGFVTGTKTDVMMTVYDVPDNSHGQSGYVQDPVNLGGAISTTKRYSMVSNNVPVPANLVSQTWYNYDEERKVVWKIRYIASLGPTVGYKTTDNTFDALGRLVKKIFQKNTPAETFVHYFQYDPASGKPWKTYTATSDVGIGSATLQATYIYYLHGGLKRVELGANIQGIDYTYTLQGALKAINNSNAAADPGGDAVAANGFYPDAFGEVLDYFPNDYNNSRSSGIQSIAGVNTSTLVPTESYAGNIKAMSWYSLSSGIGGSNSPKAYVYNYDPKYQFIAATWGTIPNFGTSPAPLTATSINQEKVIVPGSGTPGTPAYDGNGNILYLQRTDASGAASDQFIYHYGNNNNELTSIANGPSGSTNYAIYGYDVLGRETSENTGSPTTSKYVRYDNNGMVTMVARDAAFTQPIAAFVYDEAGNKIAKIGYNGSYQINQVTYYYDGVIFTQSVMSGVYGSLTPQEYEIQGAKGRLGIYRPGGSYAYQLSDHLGNVRAVVLSTGATQSAADYYPFGAVIASYGSFYRYGYQGQYSEADGETGWNNFELRMYNPKIARWFTVDPKPNSFSPYMAMDNNPVSNTDPDGGCVLCKAYEFINKVGWDNASAPYRAADGSWLVNYNGTTYAFKPGLFDKFSSWFGNSAAGKWIDNTDFVATGSIKTSFGAQVGVSGNIGGLKAKAEVGAYVYDVANLKGDAVHPSKSTAEWADKRVHNFVTIGVTSPIKQVPLNLEVKYDYTYLYYNDYNGPTMIDGTASNDWKVSVGLAEYTDKAKVIEDLVEPQIKSKAILSSTDGKTFYGLELGASVKFFLGIETKIELGLRH